MPFLVQAGDPGSHANPKILPPAALQEAGASQGWTAAAVRG